MGAYELTIEGDFEASHRLCDHPGECKKLHGHSYHIELTLRFTEIDPKSNMAIDFSKVKAILKKVLKRYDHEYLNDVLEVENPTAEYIAKTIHADIAKQMDECEGVPENIWIESVTVWETRSNRIKFRKERH